ncbi:MAG TPA: urate oxidase [Bryobacteraceae bacterium]|nr:urate oxidase [Bryobacteraceae bacterium]
MHHFASGTHRNYYGKAEVIAYRRTRELDLPFGANVTMLLYGDAFWPTYATGDNTGLIATDSMKNFIQRETLNFPGDDLESYCRFLAEKFLRIYPQTAGIQVSAVEIPYIRLAEGSPALVPGGPARALARIEITRDSVVDMRSGLYGFKLLRMSGSAFAGFVRDEYTTLPDVSNRPLHMWLDLDWACPEPVAGRVRQIVQQVFGAFESGSIQQVIYQIGQAVLEQIDAVTEVHLEANNRTWDSVAERGDLSIYTDPRPPYGVLGLTLRR